MTADEIVFWIYFAGFFGAGIILICGAISFRHRADEDRDWMRDHVEDTTATTGRRLDR